MNPIEIGRGRSFKGLSKYLRHDTAEHDGQTRSTTERVGWSETFSMNDRKPETAWRYMASTAMSADALKDAAGLDKKGAKNRKPVYHYVLTWPEADEPSDQLQKKAVGESLAALGLEDHQAVAVQHLDGAPHVHVMVNLINPENGTTPKLSYTQKKLRKWANEFEQREGLQLTKGSRINEQKRRNGETVDAKRKPRNVYEQEQREGNDRRTAWLRKKEDAQAKELQRENHTMQATHSGQWKAIKETYHAKRDALYADREEAVEASIAATKESYKPKWAKVFKANRERMKQFEQSEGSAFQKFFNAVTTYRDARKEGTDAMTAIAAAGSSAERRALIERWNKRDEDKLAAELRKEIRAAVKLIKEGHDVQIGSTRAAFLDQCKELKQQQTAAKAVQRQKWREHAERRRAAFQQVTGEQIDHSRLLRQNEGLRQYIGRRLEPD